ncbi:MAG TPA: enoyl-CoA hydratase-related protein [Acidimicrobiia bacterium]|nr:enoyl-CoA hydratase-related protein [Acidimicrobiia bacterium]
MWLEINDRGAVRWLTINRPGRRNAIPGDGWPELERAFSDFGSSSSRVLVVTGAGGAFCSGADLDPNEAVAMADVAGRHRRMRSVGAAALALHRLAKPTIAAVDGVAAGAGMNLALGCDLVVASHRARFSEIFVRRGLSVDFGGTWLLPRVVGLQRAKELALTGRIVEATEALAIGLVMELVDADRLEARVTEIADSLLNGAPVAQMFAKQGLDRSGEVSFEEALAWEGQSQSICFATEDVLEGLAAFREKRSPDFKGR